ncbi:hypothetical protein [Oceanibium sediminis]|uniref:hypothetical protein n=1 Tax=Oceanibium sediminis TaxID=2026339 RepID=UPI000DD2F7D5|nr:hypothetical protein [Oceanibium sediminis]
MSGPGRTRGLEALGIGALVLAGALVAYAFFAPGQMPLERSALGHRGLVHWLQAEGQDARYAGFETLTYGDPTLRVLPIADTDLDAPFTRPAEDRAYLMTGTERDLYRFTAENKLRGLKTLVLAPKWARALRHAGLAHYSLLLEPDEASRPFLTLDLTETPLERLSPRLVTFDAALPDGPRYDLTLYAPQVFTEPLAEGCTPLLSAPRGHLLIECARGGDAPPTIALSDPDLLNNHGLALGDNAALASELVARLSAGAPVLVDTTDYLFTFPVVPPREQRSWSELSRFYAYPFSIAWGGLAILTVLLLWRAAVRFGPPRKVFQDQMSAARSSSIRAKARVLRLAGNDRRLFETHVANRLRRIERALFGQVAPGDPQARIVEFVKRRDPALAAGFAQAATAITTAPSGTSAETLARALDDFELQARRMMNEP